jgi:hypothetical protein
MPVTEKGTSRELTGGRVTSNPSCYKLSLDRERAVLAFRSILAWQTAHHQRLSVSEGKP